MRLDNNQDLLTLIMVVARLTRVEADRKARQHGMTRAQWAILLNLERRPGINQKELADLLEVEPITVARLIDRMETNGLVERRPDKQDRRIWRLHLQPAATPYLEEIDRLRMEIGASIHEGISAETLQELVEALQLMKANLLRKLDLKIADMPQKQFEGEVNVANQSSRA